MIITTEIVAQITVHLKKENKLEFFDDLVDEVCKLEELVGVILRGGVMSEFDSVMEESRVVLSLGRIKD
jgi:hypothetical protein